MTTYTINNDSVWYYCNKDGQLQEPVTAEKLEELARQGTIAPRANIMLKTDAAVDPALVLTDKPNSVLSQAEIETLLDIMGYHPFGLPKSAGQYRTTLLHVAVINENIEFAKFLIQNDARVYTIDSNCETPLRKAVHENKSAELIKFLAASQIEMEDNYSGGYYYKDGHQPLNREQMKDLQTLHEMFSRKFAARLTTMLRTTVDVKFVNVDQLSYSEFIFGLDNPTCFHLLRVEPLDVNMILDISPSIIHPMIDRMLGGGEVEWVPTLYRQRPKTPLNEGELWLVKRVTDEFLKELKHAWHAWDNMLRLNFSVVQVESSPQIIQVVAPNEAVVVLGFEVTMTGVRGGINLCFQYDFFEKMQKASLNDKSIDSLLERADEKLKEVSQLLSDIRRRNANTEEQKHLLREAIAQN